MTEIQFGFSVNTVDTPIIPLAKRGDVSDNHVNETREQLDNGLVWWKCSFCGRYVLIDSDRPTREKCSCGAVRCNHKGQSGWRKDGVEWWYI